MGGNRGEGICPDRARRERADFDENLRRGGKNRRKSDYFGDRHPRDRGTYTPHPVRGRFSLQHSNTPKHSLQHSAEAQARAPARPATVLRDVRRHGRDDPRVHEVGARPVADAT
jgi:hypothetical protein